MDIEDMINDAHIDIFPRELEMQVTEWNNYLDYMSTCEKNKTGFITFERYLKLKKKQHKKLDSRQDGVRHK